VYPPDIQSQTIQFPSQDGTPINAYHSRPVASGRYPGVVVIMNQRMGRHQKPSMPSIGWLSLSPTSQSWRTDGPVSHIPEFICLPVRDRTQTGDDYYSQVPPNDYWLQ